MSRMVSALAILLLGASAVFAGGDRHTEEKRLEHASEVFGEIMRTPDKGIPNDLLNKAECIAIVPGLSKGGFIVGGDYGKGIVTCRTGNGWSAPSFLTLGGGSFGLQLGFEKVDVVMLIMNHRGMERLLSDKFTIGGDAAAAAGPVGRDTSAQTDAELTAEILTYSRAKGVFGGLTLNGTVVKQDHEDNRNFYGPNVSAKEILNGNATPPEAAHPLLGQLSRWSPKP
ncbi:MAG TPA: lipid-binding SYLF domain-containing protein [Blastocatellia bacterium]